MRFSVHTGKGSSPVHQKRDNGRHAHAGAVHRGGVPIPSWSRAQGVNPAAFRRHCDLPLLSRLRARAATLPLATLLSDDAPAYGSWGNGPHMRAAAVGWLARQRPKCWIWLQHRRQ